MLSEVYAFKTSKEPIGGDLYYANVSAALSVMKTSVYMVIAVLFDSFVVDFQSLASTHGVTNLRDWLYRPWIVWDRHLFVIVLPFLIFLADFRLVVLSLYTAPLDVSPINVHELVLRPSGASPSSRGVTPSSRRRRSSPRRP